MPETSASDVGTNFMEFVYNETYDRLPGKKKSEKVKVIDDLMFCPKCRKTYGYYRHHNRDATLSIEYFHIVRGYGHNKVLCLKKYGGTCK